MLYTEMDSDERLLIFYVFSVCVPIVKSFALQIYWELIEFSLLGRQTIIIWIWDKLHLKLFAQKGIDDLVRVRILVLSWHLCDKFVSLSLYLVIYFFPFMIKIGSGVSIVFIELYRSFFPTNEPNFASKLTFIVNQAVFNRVMVELIQAFGNCLI